MTKITYLQMPKTATSHTVKLLHHNFPGCGVEHKHEPLRGKPKAPDLVFASVRDPFDWYLSAWSGELVPSLGHLYVNSDDPIYFRTWMMELEQADIRRRISNNGFEFAKYGLYSHEAKRLYQRKGKWITNKFVRVEDYKNTLTDIIGEYEDPFPFKWNESLRKFSQDFYYDDKTRERVIRLDSKVSAELGYKLDV